MEILSVGYNFKHDKNFKLLRPNGLNEYLLLIIRSRAVFEINECRFNVYPNSMIFVDKNVPHSFYADGDVYINDWITFDLTDEEYKMLIKDNIDVNVFFNSHIVNCFSEIIKLMQAELQSADMHKNNNVNLFFKIILNKLYDNSECLNFDKKYYNELLKIRNDIYSNPQQQFTIEQLACKANLSKSYFQFLYKKYFNISPISDVIKSRVEYSKQLLNSTGQSISEISELMGYKDSAQFIKQFKKITNMTPNKYRKGI